MNCMALFGWAFYTSFDCTNLKSKFGVLIAGPLSLFQELRFHATLIIIHLHLYRLISCKSNFPIINLRASTVILFYAPQPHPLPRYEITTQINISNRCPPLPTRPTTEPPKKSLHPLHPKNPPNHRHIPQTLRGNGKELSEQIYQSVKLQNHSDDPVSKHDQEKTAKEGKYAS